MTTALWSWHDLVRAAGGRAEGEPAAAITGFSIDTRSLKPGEVFVALKDQRDGHEFVGAAFKAGAAAAVVSEAYARQAGDGALIRVADVLAALENIGRASRARLAPEARVIAVTGSSGKTTSKEMLRTCLEAVAPGRVHASDKSFNNHWGVPLTLARMPADTRYGVFEIGMNHAGEITPLSRMARPHVAMVTMVGAVHLAHFRSVEEIAEAKAEILAGLEPGGTAVLNADNLHCRETIGRVARRQGARVAWYGSTWAPLARRLAEIGLGAPAAAAVGTAAATADVTQAPTGAEFEQAWQALAAAGDLHGWRTAWTPSPDGSLLEARLGADRLAVPLSAPGEHMAQNALGVLLVLASAGVPLAAALGALSGFSAQAGRGQRIALRVGGGDALLIDESYNANPSSMQAAIAALEALPRNRYGRRIAVLGDMLELGDWAATAHRELRGHLERAGIDLLFAAGPLTRFLYADMSAAQQGLWAETSAGLREPLLAAVRPGDVILVKGSNGSRMGPLVEALQNKYASLNTGS